MHKNLTLQAWKCKSDLVQPPLQSKTSPSNDLMSSKKVQAPLQPEWGKYRWGGYSRTGAAKSKAPPAECLWFQGGIPGKVQPGGGARNPCRKLNGGGKKPYGHWYLCIGLTLALRKNPTGWSAFISWNVSEYVKNLSIKLQVSTVRQISPIR